MIKKDKDTMCGVACVQWICDNENKQIDINKNEVWCCSLANSLRNTGFEIIVKCFNSKLFEDCHKFPNEQFIGFNAIREYLKNNQIFIEEPTINTIKNEIANSKYVIFNVSSKIFHKDETMNGGHYIIATNLNEDIVEIVNPRETDFEIRTISIEDLQACIKDFGAWRILVK